MKNILDTLEVNGHLKILVRSGIISPKIIFYREISMRVGAYILTRKFSKTEAVEQVAIELNINSRTVLRAIAFIKKLESNL